MHEGSQSLHCDLDHPIFGRERLRMEQPTEQQNIHHQEQEPGMRPPTPSSIPLAPSAEELEETVIKRIEILAKYIVDTIREYSGHNGTQTATFSNPFKIAEEIIQRAELFPSKTLQEPQLDDATGKNIDRWFSQCGLETVHDPLLTEILYVLNFVHIRLQGRREFRKFFALGDSAFCLNVASTWLQVHPTFLMGAPTSVFQSPMTSNTTGNDTASSKRANDNFNFISDTSERSVTESIRPASPTRVSVNLHPLTTPSPSTSPWPLVTTDTSKKSSTTRRLPRSTTSLKVASLKTPVASFLAKKYNTDKKRSTGGGDKNQLQHQESDGEVEPSAIPPSSVTTSITYEKGGSSGINISPVQVTTKQTPREQRSQVCTTKPKVSDNNIEKSNQVRSKYNEMNDQARMVQHRLLLIHHAHNCKTRKGQMDSQDAHEGVQQGSCPYPHACLNMQKLLHHMKHECKDQSGNCPIPHCTSTRRILEHFRQCQDSQCLACTPVCQMLHIQERELLTKKRGLSQSPPPGSIRECQVDATSVMDPAAVRPKRRRVTLTYDQEEITGKNKEDHHNKNTSELVFGGNRNDKTADFV